MDTYQTPGQTPQYQQQTAYAYVPQPPAAPKPYEGSWGRLLLGLLLFGGCLFAQGIAVAIAFAISDDILVEEAAYEIISALIAMVLLSTLGGWRWIRLDDRKVVSAIRDCWWLLLLDCGLFALTCFQYVSEGEGLSSGWFGSFMMTALLCLGIGLCEEGMFRGLLHGSFLARFGKTRRSIVMCAVMSSLIFGLFHVLPPDPSEMNPLGIIQMVLKTLQTGICGFVWAIIATRDEDLWGVSIVHGLSDFLLIAPEAIFGSLETALSTDYVSTDASEALETIGFYVITILVYLPLIVRAIKIIRTMPEPNYGPYVRPPKPAAPLTGYVVPQTQAPAVAQAGIPAQPAPAWQQPAPVQQAAPATAPVPDAARMDAPRTLSQGQGMGYAQPAAQQQFPMPSYPPQGQRPAGGPPRPTGL